MIRYALVCDRKHEFDIWFKNSADYERQRKRGLVACPACESTEVEKALMAPSLGRGARKKGRAAAQPVATEGAESSAVVMSPQESELRTKLRELREHLVKNADNVGSRFPEEARKMHYGEIEHRSIYGEASPEEAKELHEEGVEFHPLPVLPDERN